MDLDQIETLGLIPLKFMLRKFRGWPVLMGKYWNERSFDWEKLIFKFRENGLGVNYLIDFFIYTDIKNTNQRAIYIDQPGLKTTKFIMSKAQIRNVYVSIMTPKKSTCF